MKRTKRCMAFLGGAILFAVFLIWRNDRDLSVCDADRAVSLMEAENEKAAAEPDAPDTKRIALTFDDGPHSVCTPKLLDGLKERDVKATFFVIGKNAEANPDILKRMSDEGHLIGNHTYDHVQISSLSDEAACAQITKTDDVVFRITGKHTEYVRPPFGLWKDGLECGIEMFPIMWTIDPRDWTTTNTDQVVAAVVSKARDDAIILLHDCYESSVDAALRIVDLLQAEGYHFVTVDELIV